jgi:hypothetical protein
MGSVSFGAADHARVAEGGFSEKRLSSFLERVGTSSGLNISENHLANG